MSDSATIALIALTFLLAGTVKGVIGLGLPTVALALLTATIGLPQAMALLLAPSLVTNLWQAVVGGHGRVILQRIWPFLLAATATVWIGAAALTRVDVALLSTLLGVLLATYALLNLQRPRFAVSPPQEIWVGPLIGSVNGVLTGMTGSFVVPGVLFLQAIGLPRDLLVQAMGMLFSASTVALALALGGNRLLSVELGVLSTLAVLPAIIGMMIGQRVRRSMSESRFRRLFFLALLALGVYIASGSLARLT
jgi:uncharacterized membrane protein YfcA